MKNNMRGRKKENILPVIVVYKKRKNLTKHFMSITEHDVDSILNKYRKKLLLPLDYEIVEMGMGKGMIASWQDKYEIKNITPMP